MIDSGYLDRRLCIAFREARKGKQDTVDEYRFDLNFTQNIAQLRNDIIGRTYKPSRGTAFISHRPVDREIFAAPFRDRVVHHFVCSYIVDWWERHFIYASYSCRDGKGTDAGIRDLYRKMRKVSKNFKIPTVVIKIDLSSYFCSIPRKGLYERVAWGLDRQFLDVPYCSPFDRDLYRTLKYLCREVIYDDPTVGVCRKGSKAEWEKYPRRKSLFCQRQGVGIVIGNLTSQVFSNVYLDRLDRFCSITLGEKGYGRYVDDAFFVIPESRKDKFFEESLPQIKDFIEGLGLIMNPKKTFCQNINNGIPFLGAVLYPYRIVPGQRVVRNFKSTIELVQAGEKDLDCLVSYLGRFKHMDAQHLIAKVFNDYGLDYKYQKGIEFSSKYYTDPKLYEKYRIK